MMTLRDIAIFRCQDKTTNESHRQQEPLPEGFSELGCKLLRIDRQAFGCPGAGFSLLHLAGVGSLAGLHGFTSYKSYKHDAKIMLFCKEGT